MYSINRFYFALCLLAVGCLGAEREIDERIVGGIPVSNRTEFQYKVSVRVRSIPNPSGAHICGGSLISNRHVLTAGQCVIQTCSTQNTAANLFVVIGDLSLTGSVTSVTRNVSRVILHDDYNILNGRYDVAIFELDTEVFLNNITVGVIPLATSIPEVGTNCSVAGWGVTEWGGAEHSDSLLVTTVNIIDDGTCRSTYNTSSVRYREDMLCAGYTPGGQGTCQGDAGGPLVCNGQQVGIVSFSLQCGLVNTPTIYVRIPFMLEWISNSTGIDFGRASSATSVVFGIWLSVLTYLMIHIF